MRDAPPRALRFDGPSPVRSSPSKYTEPSKFAESSHASFSGWGVPPKAPSYQPMQLPLPAPPAPPVPTLPQVDTAEFIMLQQQRNSLVRSRLISHMQCLCNFYNIAIMHVTACQRFKL